jgi:c-di-GMP-binding flagellar brake protein YcgR
MKKKVAPKKTVKARKRAVAQWPDDVQINRRREWRFDLPLPTLIEGKLPHGERFRESTTLENISSSGAYFSLDSGVVVGSKLNLVIELPRELSEGSPLKLLLGGITVRLEKPNRRSKKQGVAVRFTKNFRFAPLPKSS